MDFIRAKAKLSEMLTPDIKNIFSHLSKGEIPVTEEIVNNYIWKSLCNSNDNSVTNGLISLQKDLIKIMATAKPIGIMPPVTLTTAFRLNDWVFDRGNHCITFQQVQKMELDMEKAVLDYLFRLTVLVIEKVAGPTFVSDTALNYAARTMDYIQRDDNLITFVLDKHPEINKILQKEVSICNRNIKPLEFVDIKNISIQEGKIIVQPKVKWDKLGMIFGQN